MRRYRKPFPKELKAALVAVFVALSLLSAMNAETCRDERAAGLSCSNF